MTENLTRNQLQRRRRVCSESRRMTRAWRWQVWPWSVQGKSPGSPSHGSSVTAIYSVPRVWSWLITLSVLFRVFGTSETVGLSHEAWNISPTSEHAPWQFPSHIKRKDRLCHGTPCLITRPCSVWLVHPSHRKVCERLDTAVAHCFMQMQSRYLSDIVQQFYGKCLQVYLLLDKACSDVIPQISASLYEKCVLNNVTRGLWMTSAPKCTCYSRGIFNGFELQERTLYIVDFFITILSFCLISGYWLVGGTYCLPEDGGKRTSVIFPNDSIDCSL
jgi:hypothetical protein